MNAEIISVGTELLLGDILNSNSQFLSRELAAYGIDVLYQSTVGDNADRLDNALTLALSRADMVILTGGLGPTDDDITRETVAAHFQLPLVLHEESLTRIEEYFRNTGRECSSNNRKQAMLPEGCVVFQNDHGTAPGCAIEKYGQRVVLLPGPPRELIPMFTDRVAPYLSDTVGGTIHSHTVGVFGIPESTLDERLQDLMKNENPTVAPYAKDGEVVIRVTAKAATVEEADALCQPIIDEIRERLGIAVYGVDVGSLQKTVVNGLKEKDLKIATAESCTAGLLSGRLTEIPGVSDVFECGIAAYSKDIKHQVLGVPKTVLREKGAVSPETAAAMAVGARRVGEADIGIGITGVAGPDTSEGKDVGTVYVALADDSRVWVKKIFAGHGVDDREKIRYAATSHALDMTRRYLEALPGVMAGGQSLPTLEEQTSEKGGWWHSKKTWWLAALVTVMIAAGLFTYVNVLLPHLNSTAFEELREVYAQNTIDPDDGNTSYPEGIAGRFKSLYRRNAHVRGWVVIDDTAINYPVVQESIEDFYMDHDFDKGFSVYGVPHIKKDVQISHVKTPRSIVIYGNNPGSGQMFSDLTKYTDLDFLKDHGVVEMNTIYRSAKFKIFSVMIVGDDERYADNFDFTVDSFASEEDFLYYVSEIRQRSLFDTPVSVSEGDRLVMLTTPIDYGFDGARLVVVAREVRLGENGENDLSSAKKNQNVVMPLAWQLQQGNITVGTGSSSSATTTVITSSSSSTDGTTTSQSVSSSTVTTTAPTGTTSTMDRDDDGNQQPDDLIGETTVTTTSSSTTTTTVTTNTTTTTTTSTKPTTSSSTTVETSTSTTTTTTVVSNPSTEKPTTKPTPVPPSGGEPLTSGLVSAVYAESEYLSILKVKNLNASTVVLPGQGSNGIVAPSNKEQLQYLLASMVKAELGSASTMVNSTEAQKAQAVASYSYALYYNRSYGEPYSVRCRAIDLNNKWDKKIFDAVGEVVGVKLVDVTAKSALNSLCGAFYSAASGGYTSSCNKVWTSNLPYAVSVVSKYDNATTYAKYGGSGNFVNTVSISRDDLYAKVKTWFKNNVQNRYPSYTMPEEQFTTDDNLLPLYARSWDGGSNGGEGDAWRCVYQTNFYYERANGTKVYLTGHNIRNALGLRSHAFQTSYDADTGIVKITTQGWGHAIGLSQMGAVGYANEEGWTYIQILKHYYSVTDKSNHQLVAPQW